MCTVPVLVIGELKEKFSEYIILTKSIRCDYSCIDSKGFLDRTLDSWDEQTRTVTSDDLLLHVRNNYHTYRFHKSSNKRYVLLVKGLYNFITQNYSLMTIIDGKIMIEMQRIPLLDCINMVSKKNV
jgi:hypothetical protein